MSRRDVKERNDAIQERIDLGYTPQQAVRAQLLQEKRRAKLMRKYKRKLKEVAYEDSYER